MLTKTLTRTLSRALEPSTAPHNCPQETDSAKRLKELVENERKGVGRPAKESQDELAECEAIFGGF
jgi:hypothetical protein